MQESNRKGDWFQTYSGVAFYVLDPRPQEVLLEDIAHHLALQCRYNGACHTFYSVAEHSVRVSRAIERRQRPRDGDGVRGVALYGLLHDAAETYLGDMVRPLKLSMPAYREAEAVVMDCVVRRFGARPGSPLRDDMPVEPTVVKLVDNILLATERRDLMPAPPRPWREIEDVHPLPRPIIPMSPEEAEDAFLARFHELGGVVVETEG